MSCHIYDPTCYGARLDGVTDDLLAFQAMHKAIPDVGGRVELPPGMAWLSDTWHISKPIQLRGLGGTGTNSSGFEVAPGRIALSIDCPAVAPDRNNAAEHDIAHIDLRSHVLVHATAYGDSDGAGIGRTFTPQGVVRNGDCYIKLGEVDPTRFYRAQNPGAFAGAEPAWSPVIGSSLTDNGIVWITEAFPYVRSDATAYAVGERVYAIDDNRFYFECVVAGTSAAGAPPEMLGGDLAAGVTVGGTVKDGSVRWTCRLAAGIYLNTSNGVIRHIFAVAFTGAGIHVQGGPAMDVAGDTNADNFRVRDVFANFCGLGMYVGGSDANGYTIDALFGQYLGLVHPLPKAGAGKGGHTLHERSDGGGRVSDLYAQVSTGRGVLKNGNGICTFLSCYQELGATTFDYFGEESGGFATIIGGSLRPTPRSNCILLSPVVGRGLQERSEASSAVVGAALTLHGGASAHPFWSGDENGNMWCWGYSAGWWGLTYSGQGTRTALAVSSTAAGFDPSPGWVAFPSGYLLGDGTSATVDALASMLTDSHLRNGLRRAGDRFRDVNDVIELTTDGYRGVPWTPRNHFDKNTTWTIPADIVEPTTNGKWPAAGLKVFECVTPGSSGTKEPNWNLALNVGDVVTDGTVRWALVGFTPEMIVVRGPGGGMTTIDMNDADVTLDRSHAANAIVKLTGTHSADRQLTFPHPETDAATYRRVVRNVTAGGFGLVLGTGTGATVTIGGVTAALGEVTAEIGFDTNGAFRITPDALS